MKEIQATEKLVQKLERNCNRTVSTKVDHYHLVSGTIPHQDLFFSHYVDPDQDGWGTIESCEDGINWLTGPNVLWPSTYEEQ